MININYTVFYFDQEATGQQPKRHQNQPGVVFYSSSGSDNSLGREKSPTISSYPKGSPTTLWTGK